MTEDTIHHRTAHILCDCTALKDHTARLDAQLITPSAIYDCNCYNHPATN